MNKELTEIAYILDRSGSMQSLTESAITGFNAFLKEQQSLPGDVHFSLVLFDDEYLLPADRCPIKQVAPLDASTYIPRGTTALLDAIGRTVDNIGTQLSKTPEIQRPSKVIIAIYTDGYENASQDYTEEQIKILIEQQTDTYQWEFLFLAANKDAIATATSYGISDENASEVSLSDIGTIASGFSFSKVIGAKRMVEQGLADASDHHYSRASLKQVVEELEQEQSEQ